MAEIIIGELWIFPRFTDVHRNPAAVGEKLRPTMITFDRAFVFLRWNRGADDKARRNPAAPRQRDEVRVETTAIPSPGIACIHCVAPPPTRARFVVTHPTEHVIVKRL